MTTILFPGRQGSAEVIHFTLSEDEVKLANLRAMINGHREALVTPGRYVMLKVNGGLVMSDTQMEKRTNLDFVEAARGKVLVAGLGIGLILHAIRRKEEVTEITVVEKNPDVLLLVGHSLPPRIRTFIGDIFTWRPERGVRYDTIYFDIWSSIREDNLKEIGRLKKKFRRYLAPGGWMGAWKES
jgi:predicted membrane-bound spermidine synthase